MPFILTNPYCAPAAAEAGLPDMTMLFSSLLNDLVDTPKRQAQPERQRQYVRRQQVTPKFKPRFDVRETETAYELYGELPGVAKENLGIEFTDPETLVVRGRVERAYESKSKSKTVPDEQTINPTAAATPAETGEEEKTSHAADAADETASNAGSEGWHHATVDDDPEEPATPPGAATPPVETPETETVATPATAAQKAQPSSDLFSDLFSAHIAEKKKERLWLQERSVGEFARTFTFPSRVEHDKVSASLENGVLSIVVPKAPRYQARRVAVF